MDATGMTCELVDEHDLDTRYLAGKLSPAEAEAFEAHFFGCERCWGLVQQGLAVQSALQPDAAVTGSPSSLVRPRPRATPRWWGLAAAAGIAAVLLGVWRMGDLSESDRPEDVLRGEGVPFPVAATASPGKLTATWPQLAESDVYQVRLYAADGTVVVERQTNDTAITLLMDSLPLSRGAQVFWQVQALDRLRKPLARSDLTEAIPPPPAP